MTTPDTPLVGRTEAGHKLLNETWTFEDEWQYEASLAAVLAIEAEARQQEREKIQAMRRDYRTLPALEGLRRSATDQLFL